VSESLDCITTFVPYCDDETAVRTAANSEDVMSPGAIRTFPLESGCKMGAAGTVMPLVLASFFDIPHGTGFMQRGPSSDPPQAVSSLSAGPSSYSTLSCGPFFS
jgi:hypothetical protein